MQTFICYIVITEDAVNYFSYLVFHLQDLRDVFCQFGEVVSVSIPLERETRKKRGFAFIEFSDSDSVDKACCKFAPNYCSLYSFYCSEANASLLKINNPILCNDSNQVEADILPFSLRFLVNNFC